MIYHLPLPPAKLSANYSVGSLGQRMAKANATKAYRATVCQITQHECKTRLDMTRPLDAVKKMLMDNERELVARVTEIEKPIDEVIKAEERRLEEIETKRQQEAALIEQHIQAIRALFAVNIGTAAADIEGRIDTCETWQAEVSQGTGSKYGARHQEAKILLDNAWSVLNENLRTAQAHEAAEAENATLRAKLAALEAAQAKTVQVETLPAQTGTETAALPVTVTVAPVEVDRTTQMLRINHLVDKWNGGNTNATFEAIKAICNE